MGISVEELENHKVKPVETDTEDDDFQDTEDILAAKLYEANGLLKSTVVLLLFLSDPNFVKNITKRERGALDRQVDKLNAFIGDVEGILDAEEEV